MPPTERKEELDSPGGEKGQQRTQEESPERERSYNQGKRVGPKGESGQLCQTLQLFKQDDVSAFGSVGGTHWWP